MRWVRAVLTLGWLVLIVSLFWDPVTPALTVAENQASPFHLKGKVVEVQGQALPEVPYEMTNRIFWTMIIPLLPLFFMVAGHETWRRICPLSFVSQIPRYLGWNRKKVVLIRRTGQVEKQLALVGRESWWRRNVWYVQFGLLFLALNARILFINSDRLALAVFFIGVIALSLAVGYFWGGKTWCNYICPIAIVQKIYTEPRGLLESQAHLERAPISQSMCRAPTPDGDRSICVGCTPNCPDIDLERSYWEGIGDPSLRNVYYGFYGLIVGFYSFYYFYSGNWDYYFSGAWTHESDQLAKVLGPGLYLGGQAIGIPKLFSAPLVLGLCVALSIGVGKLLETGFRAFVTRRNWRLSEQEIVARCLSFSAYASINTFYLFGGRPNLMLLPTSVLRVVDIAIVALSTLWFYQAIQRNPVLYRREGLASSLLEQLRKLKVDISKYLEGRKLEELKPDEIYVLAKTLPSFSHEQRLQAYRNILEDALRTGKADSSASLELLREVRVEIGVTDEEHRQVLLELGAGDDADSMDVERRASLENWLRQDNYRRVIEPVLLARLNQGGSLAEALADSDLSAAIKDLREIYQIADDEHAKVIASISGTGGMILERTARQLEGIGKLAAIAFGLRGKTLADPEWENLGALLLRTIRDRTRDLCLKVLATLLTVGVTPESRRLAAQLSSFVGMELEACLDLPVSASSRTTWAESLDAELVALLRGGPLEAGLTEPKVGDVSEPFARIIERGIDTVQCLTLMLETEEGVVAALCLTGIAYLDLGRARQSATELVRLNRTGHWLLREVVDQLLARDDKSASMSNGTSITVTVAKPGGEREVTTFARDYIALGRAKDNDVCIIGPTVLPYHASINRKADAVELRKASPLAAIHLNGQLMNSEVSEIQSGSRISFIPSMDSGVALIVEWNAADSAYTVEPADTVSKLIWLAGTAIFHDLDLQALAEVAGAAEVRRYARDTVLCREGEEAVDAYLLHEGTAEVTTKKSGRRAVLGQLGAGAIIGELAIITGQRRTATITVTSSAARILVINGARLQHLLASDATVAKGLLKVVAGYVSA